MSLYSGLLCTHQYDQCERLDPDTKALRIRSPPHLDECIITVLNYREY